MQSNIYARVAPLLKEIPFNCESKQLESFLNLYHSGNIIYPGAMHRELRLPIKEVYHILEAGTSAGVLKPILEIPDDRFTDGIVQNPYKKCELLLLPKEILHELPIAKCWDDIDRVVIENAAIRQEINDMVGLEWKKYTSHQKKSYLKNTIFMNPEKCARVLQSYQNSHAEECDWEADLDYVAQHIMTSTRGHFIATPYIFIVYPYPVCTPYSLYQSFHLRNYIFYSFPSIAATIS